MQKQNASTPTLRTLLSNIDFPGGHSHTKANQGQGTISDIFFMTRGHWVTDQKTKQNKTKQNKNGSLVCENAQNICCDLQFFFKI